MNWNVLFSLVGILFIGIYVNGQQYYFNSIYEENPAGSSTYNILEHNSKYIACGVSIDPVLLNQGIVILEIDSIGNINTLKTYGDSYNYFYTGLSGSFKPVTDGFIFSGSVENSQGVFAKFWRFNESFDTLFTRDYSSQVGNWMVFGNCHITNDSGIIFCGQIEPGNDSTNIFLLKTDSLGVEQWRNKYSMGEYNYAHNVIQTYDGGYLTSGYSSTPGNDYSGDPIIIKTDSLGNIIWQKNFGTDKKDGLAVARELPDGNLIVGFTECTYQGPPYPVPPPYLKIRILKLSSEGNEIWSKIIGHSERSNLIRKILISPDGSIIAAGISYLDSINQALNGWVLKLNNWGDSVWYRDYAYYSEQASDNRLNDIFRTSDNGFILGGGAVSFDIFGDQEKIWVAKTDSSGCLEPDCDPTIGIEGMSQYNSNEFLVYPNPSSSCISFRLPEIKEQSNPIKKDNHKEIRVYRLDGSLIEAHTIDKDQRKFTLEFSSYYTQGMYLVLLIVRNEVIARNKFVIL